MNFKTAFFSLLVMFAVAGCDKASTAPDIAKEAGGETKADSVKPAGQLAATPAAAANALPVDVASLADQLASLDAAFNGGDTSSYEYAFDASNRFEGKYPIWTDLDCQVDSQRPGALWCAYGRMGQLEDRELETKLNFLANADVLTPGLRCSELLCINSDGYPVGVIQFEMRQWITTHCKRSEDLSLTCTE